MKSDTLSTRLKWGLIVSSGCLVIAFIISIVLWYKDYGPHLGPAIDSGILAELAVFLSLFVSLAALIIQSVILIMALRVFKNFEVDKNFRNMQLELVFELSRSIHQQELHIRFWKSVDSEHYLERIVHYNSMSIIDLSKELDGQHIVFALERPSSSFRMVELFKFIQYESHPFVPITIRAAIKNMWQFTSEDQLPQETFLNEFVSICHDEESIVKEELLYYLASYDSQDFIDAVNAIQNAIEQWLSSFGIPEDELVQ